MTHPIFIGGLMKSGTSLLRKLLSLHPNIFGGLETFWFSEDFVNNWKDQDSLRLKWLSEFYEVSTEEMRKIRSEANTSYEFFDLFMNFCTSRAKKKRWVEKTPDNIFHIETILQEWPEAKILVLERNFKDIYASWKKNNKRTLEIFLEMATNYLEELEKYKRDKRIKIVSYKELVTNSREALIEIFIFLDEEYLEGLENYQGDDKDYKKVLAVTGTVSATTKSLQKPIFTNSLEQWKNILSAEEITIINKL